MTKTIQSKDRKRRVIVVARGDIHAGHVGGLLNPDTQLPEHDLDESGRVVIAGWRSPELRPVQKRLWEWHEEDRRGVIDLAGEDDIVLLEMGDITQGVKYTDDLNMAAISDQICRGAVGVENLAGYVKCQGCIPGKWDRKPHFWGNNRDGSNRIAQTGI